jgi:hypothetical protein
MFSKPVKQQLEEYLSSEDIYEQQESPFGKAMNQTVDMFKATKVDIKVINPFLWIASNFFMLSVGVICQTGQPYSVIDLTRLLYILNSFVRDMFAKPFISLIIWIELLAFLSTCMAVSFIVGDRRTQRKLPTRRKLRTNFIT